MQSHPLFAIIIGIEIQRKQRGYILDHLALKDLLFFHQLCHFLVDISHLVEFSYQPQILRSNLFSETTNLSSRIFRRSGSRIGLRWRSCIEAACVRWARCRPGIGSSSGQVAPQPVNSDLSCHVKYWEIEGRCSGSHNEYCKEPVLTIRSLSPQSIGQLCRGGVLAVE